MILWRGHDVTVSIRTTAGGAVARCDSIRASSAVLCASIYADHRNPRRLVSFPNFAIGKYCGRKYSFDVFRPQLCLFWDGCWRYAYADGDELRSIVASTVCRVFGSRGRYPRQGYQVRD